jgi:glycosyltransferase involved in cell wall biosynthesis
MNNKKNIIIFTGGLRDGGAEKQSMLLAKGLKEKYNIFLISYFGAIYLTRNLDFLNNEKIVFYQLNGGILKKIKVLYSYFKKIKPHAIISFLPTNNLIGGAMGRWFGTKRIIGSVRTAKIRSQRKYYQLLFTHTFFNHKTVFNSKAGLERYSTRGFGGYKSLVIQNCLYPLPAYNYFKNSYITILVVARFENYKDYPTALEAFKKLKQDPASSAVKLQIVGIGPLQQMITDWITTNNMQNDIQVAVNPENVNDFYSKADIFLQTSLVEGFSNSVMEAMSFGLPVVATNVGDNNQMVFNSKNGYIVPVKSVDLICTHLLELVNDQQLRQKMGKESYEIMATNYSVEDFAHKFINIIE